jgi:hypothetical protein
MDMTNYKPILAFCLAAACSSNTGHVDKTADVEPVAECVQYQAALESCFHRDSSLAHDPTMIPKTPEDRVRIQQICADNLARLGKACR